MRKRKNREPFKVRFNKGEWLNERSEIKELPEDVKHDLKIVKILMGVFMPLGLLAGIFLNLMPACVLSLVQAFVVFLVFRLSKKGLEKFCAVPLISLAFGVFAGRFLILRTVLVIMGKLNG